MYDIIDRQLSYGASVGAHALTVRATYTVPNGKSARVTHISLWIVNQNANAANSGQVLVRLTNIDTLASVIIAQLLIPPGGVINNLSAAFGTSIHMHANNFPAGDILTIETVQTAALNTQYQAHICIEEY